MSTHALLEALVAKYRSHTDFAKLDLVDINQPCYPGDDALLHLVTRVGGVDEIELLVASGANVNVRGDIGYTPLHYGALRGRGDVVEMLLGLGADRSLQNEFGETPLSIAQAGGHTEIVRLLRKTN